MLGDQITLILFLFVIPASIFAVILLSYRYLKRMGLQELREKESDIEQAYNELLSIWDRDRYLEHRTISQWLKDWSRLEPLISKTVNSKFVSLELKPKIDRLFSVFSNTEEEVSQRNESFIQKEMVKFKDLFDWVEKYPLTQSQIRSIITDEYSNLVIAGAGTGKTSTILGKTGYILEKGLAKPSELLLQRCVRLYK